MSKLYIKRKYGQIPNDILNDPKLSFKAKGLFGFLQSKPNGWQFSVYRIIKQTKDRRDSIETGIKELENSGNLQREPVKNNKGQWNGYNYILYENQQVGGLTLHKNSSSLAEKPFAEKPLAEKPLADNLSTLSKKDYSNKDSSKKDRRVPIRMGTAKPNSNQKENPMKVEIANIDGEQMQIIPNLIPNGNSLLVGSAPKTYGNQSINEVLLYLKEKAGFIDGAVIKQRQICYTFIRRVKKLIKDMNGDISDDGVVDGCKWIIDLASVDKFHSKNFGRMQYLSDNIGTIVRSARSGKEKTIIGL